MAKKTYMLLSGALMLLCMLNFAHFGMAASISNAIDIESYDLVDDLYYLTNGSAAPEGMNGWADLNNTMFWDNEGQLNFNHTVTKDLESYIADPDQANNTWILFYYFPDGFENETENCTIFWHIINKNSALNNRTFVFFMALDIYVNQDWLNLTHPDSIGTMVVNQSINLDAGNKMTITTALPRDCFDLDDEANANEQIIAYAASGDASDIDGMSTIDFWPEIDEYTGEGRNPIQDAQVWLAFEAVFNIFFADDDTTTSTTTTTQQDDDGDSGHHAAATSATTVTAAATLSPADWIEDHQLLVILLLIVIAAVLIMNMMIFTKNKMPPRKHTYRRRP